MDHNFLTPEQGDAAFAKLMQSPATAKRKRVKRRAAAPVSSPDSTSENFAALSLSEVWRRSPKGKRPHRSPLDEKLPTYADWLRSKCKVKGDAVAREVARAAAEWALRKAAHQAAIGRLDALRVKLDSERHALRRAYLLAEIARREAMA
jgi:hypothetical protein